MEQDDQITLPDGYKDYVPKTGVQLPKGFESYVPKGTSSVQPPINLNNVSAVAPYAGRFAASALPAVGGIIGSLLGGGVDPITAGAGAGLGSVAAQELRNEFPRLFGNLERDPASFATQIGSDVATEGAGPELLGMAGKRAIEAFQQFGPKAPLVKVLANKFVQKISPSVGEGVEGARLSALTKEGETLSGPALAENIHVSNVLSKGVKNGKVTDPEAMLKAANDPANFLRISPESHAAIQELAKNAKLTGNTTDRVISYAKKRLVLGAAGAALGGSLGHIGEGAAGIVLTDAMLGHLMSNPDTAKLVVQAMRTPSSSLEAPLLQKILTNAARAAEVPSQVSER